MNCYSNTRNSGDGRADDTSSVNQHRDSGAAENSFENVNLSENERESNYFSTTVNQNTTENNDDDPWKNLGPHQGEFRPGYSSPHTDRNSYNLNNQSSSGVSYSHEFSSASVKVEESAPARVSVESITLNQDEIAKPLVRPDFLNDIDPSLRTGSHGHTPEKSTPEDNVLAQRELDIISRREEKGHNVPYISNKIHQRDYAGLSKESHDTMGGIRSARETYERLRNQRSELPLNEEMNALKIKTSASSQIDSKFNANGQRFYERNESPTVAGVIHSNNGFKKSSLGGNQAQCDSFFLNDSSLEYSDVSLNEPNDGLSVSNLDSMGTRLTTNVFPRSMATISPSIQGNQLTNLDTNQPSNFHSSTRTMATVLPHIQTGHTRGERELFDSVSSHLPPNPSLPSSVSTVSHLLQNSTASHPPQNSAMYHPPPNMAMSLTSPNSATSIEPPNSKISHPPPSPIIPSSPPNPTFLNAPIQSSYQHHITSTKTTATVSPSVIQRSDINYYSQTSPNTDPSQPTSSGEQVNCIPNSSVESILLRPSASIPTSDINSVATQPSRYSDVVTSSAGPSRVQNYAMRNLPSARFEAAVAPFVRSEDSQMLVSQSIVNPESCVSAPSPSYIFGTNTDNAASSSATLDISGNYYVNSGEASPATLRNVFQPVDNNRASSTVSLETDCEIVDKSNTLPTPNLGKSSDCQSSSEFSDIIVASKNVFKNEKEESLFVQEKQSLSQSKQSTYANDANNFVESEASFQSDILNVKPVQETCNVTIPSLSNYFGFAESSVRKKSTPSLSQVDLKLNNNLKQNDVDQLPTVSTQPNAATGFVSQHTYASRMSGYSHNLIDNSTLYGASSSASNDISKNSSSDVSNLTEDHTQEGLKANVNISLDNDHLLASGKDSGINKFCESSAISNDNNIFFSNSSKASDSNFLFSKVTRNKNESESNDQPFVELNKSNSNLYSNSDATYQSPDISNASDLQSNEFNSFGVQKNQQFNQSQDTTALAMPTMKDGSKITYFGVPPCITTSDFTVPLNANDRKTSGPLFLPKAPDLFGTIPLATGSTSSHKLVNQSQVQPMSSISVEECDAQIPLTISHQYAPISTNALPFAQSSLLLQNQTSEIPFDAQCVDVSSQNVIASQSNMMFSQVTRDDAFSQNYSTIRCTATQRQTIQPATLVKSYSHHPATTDDRFKNMIPTDQKIPPPTPHVSGNCFPLPAAYDYPVAPQDNDVLPLPKKTELPTTCDSVASQFTNMPPLSAKRTQFPVSNIPPVQNQYPGVLPASLEETQFSTSTVPFPQNQYSSVPQLNSAPPPPQQAQVLVSPRSSLYPVSSPVSSMTPPTLTKLSDGIAYPDQNQCSVAPQFSAMPPPPPQKSQFPAPTVPPFNPQHDSLPSATNFVQNQRASSSQFINVPTLPNQTSIQATSLISNQFPNISQENKMLQSPPQKNQFATEKVLPLQNKYSTTSQFVAFPPTPPQKNQFMDNMLNPNSISATQTNQLIVSTQNQFPIQPPPSIGQPLTTPHSNANIAKSPFPIPTHNQFPVTSQSSLSQMSRMSQTNVLPIPQSSQLPVLNLSESNLQSAPQMSQSQLLSEPRMSKMFQSNVVPSPARPQPNAIFLPVKSQFPGISQSDIPSTLKKPQYTAPSQSPVAAAFIPPDPASTLRQFNQITNDGNNQSQQPSQFNAATGMSLAKSQPPYFQTQPKLQDKITPQYPPVSSQMNQYEQQSVSNSAHGSFNKQQQSFTHLGGEKSFLAANALRQPYDGVSQGGVNQGMNHAQSFNNPPSGIRYATPNLPPPGVGGIQDHEQFQYANRNGYFNQNQYQHEAPNHQIAGSYNRTPYQEQSVTRSGFDSMRGMEVFDLLRLRNVLPSEPMQPQPVFISQEFPPEFNCSPLVVRSTISKIPTTKALLEKSRLPLGIIIHPFKDLNSLSVIQSSTIVRCRMCRTYINPFVTFLDNRVWQCNLCHRSNEIPDEFRYNPVTHSHDDPTNRPEVKVATVEFIAPSEYMVRPPQPAVYLFLFDVSRLATLSGYLDVVCGSISDALEEMPGDKRTCLGFITFDSAVHFYTISESSGRPQEIVLTDIDDVFLPCPDELLVNREERLAMIKELLKNIPSTNRESTITECAFGAALQAAQMIMSPTGGRISAFLTSLPNFGPGKLKSRESPNQNTEEKKENLNPATDFYKLLALNCNGHQISIDLFFLNSQYVDIATVSTASQVTGGSVYHIPLFNSKNYKDAERLELILSRHLRRKIGFEAVMRVRCTRGLSIHSFHGNCFVRTTDLLALPIINPDASFGMQLSIEEQITSPFVSFQAALLYTSTKGERRIRVHTLCLPTTTSLSDVIYSGDQQCIAGLLAKMAVDRSMQFSITDARDAFMNAVSDILQAFRTASGAMPDARQLLAPNCLSMLPMYIFALMKSVAFRTRNGPRLDDRIYAMYQMKNWPLVRLIKLIYPDLYPVHNLAQYVIIRRAEELQDDGSTKIVEVKSVQPPLMQLSAERIEASGVYLLDDGETFLLFIGYSITPITCQDLFGVSEFANIPNNLPYIPDTGRENNVILHHFINDLQNMRSQKAQLQIIKDATKEKILFYDRLVEDKTSSGPSYYEFLQQIRSQLS